jgi:hypothetical protein
MVVLFSIAAITAVILRCSLAMREHRKRASKDGPQARPGHPSRRRASARLLRMTDEYMAPAVQDIKCSSDGNFYFFVLPESLTASNVWNSTL